MCNFWSIHFHGKRLYAHMFNMVDTAFSNGRALFYRLLISSGIFQGKKIVCMKSEMQILRLLSGAVLFRDETKTSCCPRGSQIWFYILFCNGLGMK